MANERKTVMVSSTARDLPEHRKEVMDACLRQGMFPTMMEHLPASDAEAIGASLKMVDEADIYVGVFAYRYGYIPKENNPTQISVTEMEYNRAVERNIPRLIFVMDKSHPITAEDMDIENAGKLKIFKDHVQIDNIVNFFKSPADLRANVINSLSHYRESDVTQFHYVSNIPQPPEAYIAHPYTLLQTHRLVGRQKELNLLTNWVTKKQDDIYYSRILNIVAIGGMGKSALTWNWFNDIAPQEMNPLAGRMWWSFYESDATFENFIIRALAYVSRKNIEEIKQIPPSEREEQLLLLLDREPYLFVLDGLERVLIAYARMDAARLFDDDIDQRTANFIAKAYGLPESAAQSFVGQHLLRKTTDPRAGSFFRKLANARSARILVSTRLYPADLQSVTGEPIRGCSAIFLPGLSNDNALDLWRAFNVSGSREQLLPLFNKFENHPLLMQSLASEIGSYRRAPGDFERWRKDHPNFDPFNLPMTQVKGHVLGFAMQGLYKNARKVLETIAGFRMPAYYDTLAAIFVGEGKIFPTELGLDQSLKELEDRGLLGWDKRANRYDLHPIVRGVVWGGLPDNTRNGVFSSLQKHFDSVPKKEDSEVNSLEDLTSAIELYNTLIGLRRYTDAFSILKERLITGAFRVGLHLQICEWVEMLLLQGQSNIGFLEETSQKAQLLTAAALAYHYSGQLQKVDLLYNQAFSLYQNAGDSTAAIVVLGLLGNALWYSGNLFRAQIVTRHGIELARSSSDNAGEAFCLSYLGLVLGTRGLLTSYEIIKRRTVLMKPNSLKEFIYANHATIAVLRGNINFPTIMNILSKLMNESPVWKELFSIFTLRIEGMANLDKGDLEKANKCLNDALIRARTANCVPEELPTLIAITELLMQRSDLRSSREILENLWESLERGPYPLLHADALNVLAQIERIEGNKDKAIEAATKAFRLAWCDGPPYAYHWGMEKAKQHLKDLGALEPEMPPFDESKFEPMPEVDINPKDEFWVDPDKEFDINEFLDED